MKQTSGLKFQVNIIKTDSNAITAVWNGLASGVLICGLILLAGTSVTLSGAKTAAIIFSFAVPIVSDILAVLLKKQPVIYVVPTVVSVLTFVISPSGTLNGAIGFYNSVLDMLGRKNGRIMPLLEQISPLEGKDTALFLIFAVSVCFLIFALSRKSRFYMLPSVVSTVVFVFFCNAGEISKIGFALTIAGISTEYLSACSIPFGNIKSFFYRGAALICCFAVIISCTFIGGNNNLFKTAEKSISETVDTLRYGKGNILPQGDFSKIRNFEPTDEIQLEVVMSNPDSYYLRGFVGEVYNGNGWETIDNDKLYEYSNLFYWLHKSDFYGQTQLADVAVITEQSKTQNRIIIRNIDTSRKYIYNPYEALDFVGGEYENLIGDRAFATNGNKTYTINASSNHVKQYTTIAAELYEREKESDEKTAEYLKNEAHYNAFVYENYLEIPEETVNLLEGMLGEYKAENGHMDYGKAKQKILGFLTSNMVYSTDAESYGGDFLDSFLQRTRKGYSVHFASAAAVMFRYYGIPARYVEGYLITPEDVEGVVADSAIKIRETNAHAWVEFYQDGIGWIPFETTPPYIDVMEKADDLTGVNTQLEEIPKLDSETDETENDEEKQGIQQLRRQKAKRIALTVLAVALIACVLSGMIILLIVALINRKKLMKLKESFASSDNRKAVLALFGYASGFCYGKEQPVNEIYLSEKEKSAEDAFAVYEKARFSRHDITGKEKEAVCDFKNKTLEDFVGTRSKCQKFVDRYIKYRY